jgi:hypothetical protein
VVDIYHRDYTVVANTVQSGMASSPVILSAN